MKKEDMACAHCGHLKSWHYHGVGACEDTSEYGGFCRCSRYAKPKKNRDTVMRELEKWGGSYSPFGYRMRRAAETFFPVWEKDRSFAMFDKCCDIHGLTDEQRCIVKNCLEKNGFKESREEGLR